MKPIISFVKEKAMSFMVIMAMAFFLAAINPAFAVPVVVGAVDGEGIAVSDTMTLRVDEGVYSFIGISFNGVNKAGQTFVLTDISRIILRLPNKYEPVDISGTELKTLISYWYGNVYETSTAAAAYDFTHWIPSGRPNEPNGRYIPEGTKLIVELTAGTTALKVASGNITVVTEATKLKQKYSLKIGSVDVSVAAVNTRYKVETENNFEKTMELLITPASTQVLSKIEFDDSQGKQIFTRAGVLMSLSNMLTQSETAVTTSYLYKIDKEGNPLNSLGKDVKMYLTASSVTGTAKVCFICQEYDEIAYNQTDYLQKRTIAKAIEDRGGSVKAAESETIKVLAKELGVSSPARLASAVGAE